MTSIDTLDHLSEHATVKRTPRMIAIGGPSCSGKTTLARRLVEHWGAERAQLISLDRFYRDLSQLTLNQRSRVNFDHPDSLDGELLLTLVKQMAAGDTVDLPTYDFATHTRSDRTDRIEPVEFIVVEGLFTHFWTSLCEVMHVKAFLEIDNQTALDRRIQRDTRERGRTEDSVRQQWNDSVLPMQSQFIDPTQSRADLVMSGRRGIDDLKQQFLKHFCQELDR